MKDSIRADGVFCRGAAKLVRCERLTLGERTVTKRQKLARCADVGNNAEGRDRMSRYRLDFDQRKIGG